jgi:nitroreductase/Pyruvate/2-oxoacid:ferredoxin oxidoreductase delta subunit
MKNHHVIAIDEEKCIQCRLCAIECPANTAAHDQIHSDPHAEFCDRCFHCYAICPQHAIQVKGVEEETIPEERQIEYQDLLMHLKRRRSHRNFKRLPVSNDVLGMLTESAKYSPTGGNAQELSITIINNTDTRKELESAIINYYDQLIRLLRNPVIGFVMKFSGDAKVRETARDSGFFIKIEKIYREMKTGVSEDCILAASNVVLAATSLQLGSCFVSLSQQAINSSKKIKQLMGIPSTDQVHAVLVLGYPAVRYRRVVPRDDKNILFR